MVNSIWLPPLGALLGIFLLYRTGTMLYTHHKAKQVHNKVKNVNPSNTIFAFDIHGVIFNPNFKQILLLLWQVDNKKKLIFHMCNPRVLWNTIGLLKKGAVAEEYIMKLAQKHPQLEPYVPTGIAIANAQTPVKKTVDLIAQLKQKGYELHILSNIGPAILDELHKEHPAIFDQFDARRVAEPKDDYQRKPGAEIYRDYLESLNPNKHRIIFIDDKISNINAALLWNIIGIPFTSSERLNSLLKRMDAL